MNYLIINKTNVVEFKYATEMERFIKMILDDESVHVQHVIKIGSSVYVNDHQYLVEKLGIQKPMLTESNPF